MPLNQRINTRETTFQWTDKAWWSSHTIAFAEANKHLLIYTDEGRNVCNVFYVYYTILKTQEVSLFIKLAFNVFCGIWAPVKRRKS